MDGDCCGGYSCVSGECTVITQPPPPTSSASSALPWILGGVLAAGAVVVAVSQSGKGESRGNILR